MKVNSRSSQEEIFELLVSIKRELTPEVIAELVEKGIPEEFLINFLPHAMRVGEGNIDQEVQKGNTAQDIYEQNVQLSELFNYAKTICNIGKMVYADNPKLVKQKFTMKNLLAEHQRKVNNKKPDDKE